MKMRHIEAGSKLELNVSEEALTTRPAANKRRYSLSELLQGVTPAKITKHNAETAWAREGAPVGKEVW
jgi:antitoxin ChpS